MQAQVHITEADINRLIGHTLSALRRTQRHGAKARTRQALVQLHKAKRWINENPRIAWLFVNAAYWRLRTALVL